MRRTGMNGSGGAWLQMAVVGVLLIGITGAGVAPVASVQSGSAASWDISFEESAEASGIAFQSAGEIHDPNGEDQSWPAFPEVMGVGACWADFDGDGYEDLYIANQRYNDVNRYAQGYNEELDPTNRLYMNDGDATFTDRTTEAGVESRTFDYGCSGVDYDGDGHVDLLVYGFGHVKLYRNVGDGTFTEVTDEAGLDVVETACHPYECFTSCSAWVDYDGDGLLDLFVCTFVDTDMTDNILGPGGHEAQLNFLFRNNGDGTFTDLAEQAGVQGSATDEDGSKSWGALWFDADRDGWPDLYVANDLTRNEFYWNDADGTFTRDDEAGLDDPRAGMGVTSGDSNRNGYPDLYMTHYASQNNGYYVNHGGGVFEDLSGKDELGNDFVYVGWGTHFVDMDRDGWLDLMAVNGQLDWDRTDYDQLTLVFRQEPGENGDTKWVDMTDGSGPGVTEERPSRGAAFADYDLDGNVDVLVGNNGNRSVQFLRGSGNANHWLYVQPVQSGPNHQAIGALVIVEADGIQQYREIQAGASFMSQNTLLADFGLGTKQQVDRVSVVWPDGTTSIVEDLPVDRVIRIDRDTGAWSTDTLSPITKAVAAGEEREDGWYSSAVDIHLETEDRAVGPPSGVARSEFLDEDGTWRASDGEVFQFPAVEANHTIRVRSEDHAGNEEPERSLPIRIDLTPPVASHEVNGLAGSNGWWLDAQVELTAQDALSGVDRLSYRLDGAPWTDYASAIALQEGVHLVEYFATDRAGNAGPREEVLVRVDPSPPLLSMLQPVAGTVYYGQDALLGSGSGPSVVIAPPGLAGQDAEGFAVRVESFDETSGVARVTFFLNDEPVAEVLDPQPETVWTWDTSTYPAGSYNLQAVAQDRAGNVQVADQSVVLVPVNEGGLTKTVFDGPSLYPVPGPPWPGMP